MLEPQGRYYILKRCVDAVHTSLYLFKGTKGLWRTQRARDPAGPQSAEGTQGFRHARVGVSQLSLELKRCIYGLSG